LTPRLSAAQPHPRPACRALQRGSAHTFMCSEGLPTRRVNTSGPTNSSRLSGLPVSAPDRDAPALSASGRHAPPEPDRAPERPRRARVRGSRDGSVHGHTPPAACCGCGGLPGVSRAVARLQRLGTRGGTARIRDAGSRTVRSGPFNFLFRVPVGAAGPTLADAAGAHAHSC
jgi:hypothetical protein